MDFTEVGWGFTGFNWFKIEASKQLHGGIGGGAEVVFLSFN